MPPPGRLKRRPGPSAAARKCDPRREPSPRTRCKLSGRSSRAPVIQTSNHLLVFLAATATATALGLAPHSARAGPSAGAAEFQLAAPAGGLARLPCLIGKQALCGEPYFIAWYKLNATSRQWTRVEARGPAGGGGSAEQRPDPADRIQFLEPRAGPSAAVCLPGLSSLPGDNADLRADRNQLIALTGGAQKSLGQFDCGQLTISALELADEGQYKCEITFSDSLDFDSCPASTATQLNVIARPGRPEILLNGRLVPAAAPASASSPSAGLTFKEGAQVRLECQSAGGKPAPRIEWLNLTSADELAPGARRTRVQLMRPLWPTRRTSFPLAAEPSLALSNSPGAAGQPRAVPVTSSAVTITLSRFDMRSRFVCVVVAAEAPLPPSSSMPAKLAADEAARDRSLAGLPESVRDPARLAELLGRAPGSAWAANEPLLAWTQLDVLAKPTSVSVRVLDLAAHSLVRPELLDLGRQPVHPLQPNRLYAIQCLVEESRPRSQVAWFNRTAPLEPEQQLLQPDGPDYLAPARPGHRLTSFVRYAETDSGAFRTIASLVLTTSLWDNFDELFCRASNEAFQFDELAQVAPIISARLHVSYPPVAWLEAPDVKWTEAPAGRLSAEPGQRLQLRCLVAANPLMQNTILSIDWLKDGRRLAPGPPASASANASRASGPQIENTSHLHTPLAGPALQLDLASRISASGADPQQSALLAGRLFAASSLTITSASKQDAGQYSCQFSLMPMARGAPLAQLQQVAGVGGPLTGVSYQQQQAAALQMKAVTSGQANQSIQLNVIEAKLPTVRAAAPPPTGALPSPAGPGQGPGPWTGPEMSSRPGVSPGQGSGGASPAGAATMPVVRTWLANHLDLALLVGCAAALVWLAGAFVSPLVRRTCAKQTRPASSQWRFDPRARSLNEIGLFGGSHKFSGACAPNYYGAPGSAGGDSSEQDMVQSCSQSSHYEDFVQHQLGPRLAQQQQQQQQQQAAGVQPLYFNQALLLESATLARRPLMKSSHSSSSASGETSGGAQAARQPLSASRIYGDARQLQLAHSANFATAAAAATATMHHGHARPPNGPLVPSNTASRINFADLQPARHFASGPHLQATFGRHHATLAPHPPAPPRPPAQEHIYDDVN